MSNEGRGRTISFYIPEDVFEDFEELPGSRSEKGRHIIKAYTRSEKAQEISDETEAINLAVLQTYLNAVEKNIEVMKNQRDKLRKQIEKIEEDEEEEVLVEVEINVDGKEV